MISISCACGEWCEVDNSLAGSQVACPNCAASILVPAAPWSPAMIAAVALGATTFIVFFLLAGLLGLFVWGLIAFVALMMTCHWHIFSKAGKPGWIAVIPVYNLVMILEIVNRPMWWCILAFIPFVGLIVWIVIALDLAASFGKDTLFAVGLMLLPFYFYPVLAFGDSTYQPIHRSA